MSCSYSIIIQAGISLRSAHMPYSWCRDCVASFFNRLYKRMSLLTGFDNLSHNILLILANLICTIAEFSLKNVLNSDLGDDS